MKYFFIFFLILSFLTPQVHAAVSTDNTALIQKLLAQIVVLQAELAKLIAQQGGTPSCTFTRLLVKGTQGADVTCLQNFLKSKGHFQGTATGLFGPMTEAAVSAWQHAEGIVAEPWEYGHFGEQSRNVYTRSIAEAKPGPIASVSAPAPNIPIVPTVPKILLTEDTTPPTLPTNVMAVAGSSSQITLSWNTSIDIGGAGLKGYAIYSVGTVAPLNEVPQTGTIFTHIGLTADTPYSYQIEAIDNAGNKSGKTSPISATTQASEYKGISKSVTLKPIPSWAEIVYHANNFIYVTDSTGSRELQITFDNSKHLEHVAVSFDRRYIVANYFTDVNIGGFSSRLVLYDLKNQTEIDVLPQFAMAGNGGVDWDPAGNIYFTGVDAYPGLNPNASSEYKKNLSANNIWRMNVDGTAPSLLVHFTDRGLGDVSVSEDGSLIAFMATRLNDGDTEIWVANSDGSNRKAIFKGGQAKVSSVHDPEISPDNQFVVFSQVNPNFHNFPHDGNANTAHDITRIDIRGAGPSIKLSAPGPISIIPDWKDQKILYLELTDQENPHYLGLTTMNVDGSQKIRIKPHANIGKWIPSAT